MAEDNKDQKTEEPSSKRITDTEEKGNFAHSREINSAFILLAALSGFMITGDQSTRNVLEAWHNMISESSYIQLNTEELFKVATNTMKAFIKIAAPIMAILFFLSVGLGLVARTVPQMNVFIVGFPLQIGIGLLMVGISISFFSILVQQEMHTLPEKFMGFMRGI